MKQCPECQQSFPDEHGFCLFDGTQLYDSTHGYVPTNVQKQLSSLDADLTTLANHVTEETQRLTTRLDDLEIFGVGPALKQAVKQDPSAIIESVTPIIGSAIRAAITNTMGEFVQSFDEAVKHSFSVQGLRWRLEAIMTGRSFAEVVTYNSLLYRVEQAFLFHKKTGLLLQHIAISATASNDADMISGMLTAINDFANESFKTPHEQSLTKLDYGDLQVWIEGGTPPIELAYLAVVINGNAPESLRTEVLLPALEAIHREQREALISFEGDASPFALSRPHLEECLQAQSRGQSSVTEQPKGFRLPRTVAALLALLLLLLGTWGFFNWRAQQRWDAYLVRLQAEPGLIVIEQGRNSGGVFGARFYIRGLRDPLAADPLMILRDSALVDPAAVTSEWQPYQALHPAFILARAKILLEPPDSVTLSFNSGILRANGKAPSLWITEARKLARVIPGVTAFQSEALVIVEPPK